MAALIVEDGSNVANANSYATLQQIRDYNTARGVTLPADDNALAGQALAAMDYIQTFEARFAGDRTYGLLQRLSWPRRRVCVFGTKVPNNMIPPDIVDVQCYVAGQADVIDLYGNQDGRAILKEVIGPLETDYSATAGATAGPVLPTVLTKLQPYFKSGAGMIRSVRV